MINLAGNKDADAYIQSELHIAGIDQVKCEASRKEVAYSITGLLGDWTFERAWYYWKASAPDGKGLPLEIATQLHELEYPIVGHKQPKTYGEIIRVAGDCSCPHPEKWAFPTKKVFNKESKRIGIDWKQTCYRDLAELCNNGSIIGERFVNSYHIDDQIGLNEFAKVIRSL